MPWVRFDDQFPINRKVGGLSDAAFRLHVEAIFWCARGLTDGCIAEEELRQVSRIARPDGHVAELVRRGLWHGSGHDCKDCPQPVDGWVVHDYLVYQPPKRKVLDDRAKKAEAGRKGGIRSGETRRSGKRGSKREANLKQGASGLVELPDPPSSSKKGPGLVPAHPYQPNGHVCGKCPLPESHRIHRSIESEAS